MHPQLIMSDKNNIKIFSGQSSEYLAKEIAKSFGTSLGDVSFQKFSDGETLVGYQESIRGKHVFIVQSTFQPSDNLFELLMMIDAAKRASAYKVVAVMPYFGYARQDRKDRARVAITAKMVANLLTAAGVDRVITMDLHADQIQGFFDKPVDHLFFSSIMVPYIKSLNLDNLVIASPDMGGAKRARTYASFLNADMAIGHKARDKANEVSDMKIIGDVKGKNVIIVDDMVDTAGTLTKAADLIMEQGALSVRAAATHGVLSGPAYDRINESSLVELIISNSIPIKDGSKKIKVLSVADIFAEVIDNVYSNQSISNSFLSY